MNLSQTKIVLLLLLIFTTCSCQISRSPRQQSDNEGLEDPSVQFFENLTFLEPPSQRSLTDEQFRIAQPLLDQDAIELPKIRPLEVKGDLELSGNSDINALNDLIYKNFVQKGYAGTIDFSGIDSNSAVKLFCEEGKFDILTVSQPMSDREIDTCESNGRQPIEFAIAKDALVIVVNRQDTFIKNLTLPNLQKLFQVENWSEVNSNWPDETIKRYLIIPETLLFNRYPEQFLSQDKELIINSLNTNLYKFYQPLSQDLSVTRYGLGYVSYHYYLLNSQSLRAVPIEGHVANAETVQSGVYPFGNNLFLYADLNQFPQKNQVSAFINFYLTHVNDEIGKVGYLPLPEQELNDSKSNWLKAMGIEK